MYIVNKKGKTSCNKLDHEQSDSGGYTCPVVGEVLDEEGRHVHGVHRPLPTKRTILQLLTSFLIHSIALYLLQGTEAAISVGSVWHYFLNLDNLFYKTIFAATLNIKIEKKILQKCLTHFDIKERDTVFCGPMSNVILRQEYLQYA